MTMLNKNEYGNIEISKNAINDIANIVASKTANIYPIKKDGDFASCIYKDDELKIVLTINIKQGVDVAKISSKLQAKVREAILEMTGIDPKSINIDIQGFVGK